jgi:DNA polymerase-3 subunit chi
MSTPPEHDVIFYVLNSSDPAARERFLIKLIAKAHQQNRRVDVRFGEKLEAQRFDQTLWAVPAHSYLPHAVEHELDAPIQLFGAQIQQACLDVLINLHPDFYADFTRYRRTIELLDQSAELIEKGRERYRQYKQHGLVPTVHKIGF